MLYQGGQFRRVLIYLFQTTTKLLKRWGFNVLNIIIFSCQNHPICSHVLMIGRLFESLAADLGLGWICQKTEHRRAGKLMDWPNFDGGNHLILCRSSTLLRTLDFFQIVLDLFLICWYFFLKVDGLAYFQIARLTSTDQALSRRLNEKKWKDNKSKIKKTIRYTLVPTPATLWWAHCVSIVESKH